MTEFGTLVATTWCMNREITIYEGSLAESLGARGIAKPNEMAIILKPGLPPEERQEVLYHEMLHLALFQLGRPEWEDEQLITPLGGALAQMRMFYNEAEVLTAYENPTKPKEIG